MNSLGSWPIANSTACSIDGADRLSRRNAADRLVRVAATRGVGSSVTAVRRSNPPSQCWPAPFVSLVRGVGSSDPTSIPSGVNVEPTPGRAFRNLARYCSIVPPGS